MARVVRWNRAVNIFLVLWVGCLIYFIVSYMGKSQETESGLQTELEGAKIRLQRLQKENGDLRSLLSNVQNKIEKDKGIEESPAAINNAVSQIVGGPSKEYELLRRQTRRDVNEMWWYIRANLEELLKKDDLNDAAKDSVKIMLSNTQHHEQVVLADLAHLKNIDGHEEWRENEAKELSDLVQARLKHLQNPKDCSSARKLLCSLNKGCGYGCQIHHAIYCFIVAYGTERMLVLKSKGWRYDKAGFEDVFLPLSDTCKAPIKIENKQTWPGHPDALNVELGIVDSVNPRPKFLPPSIPSDLADRIIRLHGDPIVWWVAQFLQYFLRPQPELASLLKDTEKAQNFEHPIVGIHVRRTDKVGTEAAFHGVGEYMKYVEEYYQTQEVIQGKKIPVKRVYVASDDPRVLDECRSKFPDYLFLGDPSLAKSAAVSNRYNTNSLRGIITDIHLLSKTDFLVCTFSSQVCRIAYEIMQQFHSDAADRFKSLDDIWYFGGQDEHQHEVYIEHKPKNRNELELEVGDVIGVAGNHWNGFNKGKNHRSKKVGLYPEYKTKDKIKIVDFPTYPDVKA